MSEETDEPKASRAALPERLEATLRLSRFMGGLRDGPPGDVRA